jgi:thiol-disulfide isomerase/thioredoxin
MRFRGLQLLIGVILASLSCVRAQDELDRGLVPKPSAEQSVLEGIKSPGTTVVHLWAPWCSNCQAELKSGGWTGIVKENPSVRFYFVSVWNAGQDGRAMLQAHQIAGQANVTILADPGPRGADHITHFAGLPLSWIPTTWIFKGGDLRYALNYGEIHFPMLQQMLTDSAAKW